MRKAIALFMVLTMALAVGCGGKSVKRIDTEEVRDLSGRWNDTDSRLVSEEMIADVVSRPWIRNFKRGHGEKLPVVIVGTVRNMSHEHISVQTFTKDLERSLINSGEVDFVASSGEREELREERKEQAVHAREDTAKSHGMELGADFMLKGSINTIQDKEGGKSVMFYQVNLELIDIESNRKVWIGEKKIKKFIKKHRFSL
jgi:uncharacterized protein (TIGR02722 family)